MAVNGRFVVTLVNFRVDMVREWNVPQRSFLIEKNFGGADLAQIVIRNEYMILKTALKNLMESWVGPVYLVIFFLLGGTSSILRTFWGRTSQKKHPVHLP